MPGTRRLKPSTRHPLCLLDAVSEILFVVENPADDRADVNLLRHVSLAREGRRAALADALGLVPHRLEPPAPLLHVPRAQVHPALRGPGLQVFLPGEVRGALVPHLGDAYVRAADERAAVGRQDGEADRDDGAAQPLVGAHARVDLFGQLLARTPEHLAQPVLADDAEEVSLPQELAEFGRPEVAERDGRDVALALELLQLLYGEVAQVARAVGRVHRRAVDRRDHVVARA